MTLGRTYIGSASAFHAKVDLQFLQFFYILIFISLVDVNRHQMEGTVAGASAAANAGRSLIIYAAVFL